MEKRARLKTAGLALFAIKGFEGASIDDVGSRAKLAAGGFYQYFRSKRQVLLVLMDEQLPDARSSVDIPGLAHAMDTFFWVLPAQAVQLSRAQLTRQIDSASHLIYHALFTDRPME